MQKMQERIEQRLVKALSPSHLMVVNESYKHKGHAGDDGSGESHFSVVIKSDKFANTTRLERHNMVMKLLESEVKAVHSITISVDV